MSVAAPEVFVEPTAHWADDPRNDGPPDLLTGFRFPEGYRVRPTDAGRLVSREEFWELREDASWKLERAGGKLVVMPRSGRPHRRAAYVFRGFLSEYWITHRDRVVDFQPERWVLLEDHTDRFPDAAVILQESPLAGAGLDEELDPDRVPDVLFEFVSPGSDSHDRDYDEKRADYHTIGVREYVIVDPLRGRVTVLRWEADGYAEAAVLGPTDSYASPLLPGLNVPLAEALGDDEPANPG